MIQFSFPGSVRFRLRTPPTLHTNIDILAYEIHFLTHFSVIHQSSAPSPGKRDALDGFDDRLRSLLYRLAETVQV